MKYCIGALIAVVVLAVVVGAAYLYYVFIYVNDAPPTYMKAVAAYQEGSDGLAVYFVLADAQGQPTSADGFANLKITQNVSYWSDSAMKTIKYDVVLLEKQSGLIVKSSFYKTKVGLGAFQHDTVLYSFGRIPYSSFTQPLKDVDYPSGTVELTFTTMNLGGGAGETFTGKESISF